MDERTKKVARGVFVIWDICLAWGKIAALFIGSIVILVGVVAIGIGVLPQVPEIFRALKAGAYDASFSATKDNRKNEMEGLFACDKSPRCKMSANDYQRYFQLKSEFGK